MKKANRGIYAVMGVLVLLVAGLVYAWSVLASVINRELEKSQSEMSLTFTIVMITFCLGGLIAGIIGKKIKPMWIMIIAAALLSLGFVLASFTKGMGLLYLGFGILAGFGSGFAYNAVMSTVSMWFLDKQGLISGILLMGFGLSSFIVGKVFVAVNPVSDILSWRTSFRIMAIIIAVILVISSFFFVKPSAEYMASVQGKKKAIREPATDINASAMVKKPTFWMYYIWAILTSAAGLAIVSQANGMAFSVADNLSAGTIATVVGLISIANGVGRVIFGALFDKKGYKATMLLDMIIFMIAGIILILAIKTGAFVLIIVGFILGGIAYGGVPPTNSAIISDFFGRSNFAVNYSLVNTNLIIASTASTIAGKLYDVTASYISTAILIIGVTAFSFVFFLVIKRPGQK